MERNNILIAFLFILALALITIVNTSFLRVNYYTIFDAFGPFSVYPLAFLCELALPIIFMIILYRTRNSHPLLLLIPFILLVAVLYIGTELVAPNYATNFQDSVTHLTKGLYVSATGHSNFNVDRYFDMQPGFFWVTAVLSNVYGLSLTSFVDAASLFILKWTPLLMILVYTPILCLFYKQLLKSNLLVSIALLIHFSLELLTFHYSAQTYGQAIYWLILSMTLFLSHKNDRKFSFLALMLSISMFFVHKGLVIIVLLSLIALVIYPLPFKTIAKDSKYIRRNFIVLPVTIAIAWFSYLIYTTQSQAGNLLNTIGAAFGMFLSEGTQLISIGTTRAYPLWAQIVSIKSIYILIIVSIGIVLSFINATQKKEDEDKLSFTILLLSTVFFGGAAIGLGGAGYIERLPTIMMPLIVYSLIKFGGSKKLNYKPKYIPINIKKLTGSILAIVIITIVFVGPTFYITGKNYQSVTFGEYYSTAFLSQNSPRNIEGIYPGLKVFSIRDYIKSEVTNETINNLAIVNVQRKDLTETYYYTIANMSYIQESVNMLYGKMSVVYSNPDAEILVK